MASSSYEFEGDTNEPLLEPDTPDLEQRINTLQKRIADTFLELIRFLEKRKTQLLRELEGLKAGVLSKSTEQTRIEKQRIKLNEVLNSTAKENVISEIVEGARKTIDAKIMEYTNLPVTFDYDFKTDNLAGLKEMISKFGSIQSTNIDYTQIKGPKLCFGGSGEGGIVSPRALAVDNNDRIFVADAKKPCVHVYSIRGHFIREFGKEILSEPWGVCCSEDKVFVTDHTLHAVFSFSLSNFNFIQRACNLGSHVQELNSPTSVNFDAKKKEIYVADYLNNRIAIFDSELRFKRFLLENSVEGPICVNITEKRIFILECRSPNFRSYTKEGTDPQSHYSIGKKEVIKSMLFFCVDNRNNLILSDYGNHCIRVINYRGEVIKSIGTDRLLQPTGICLSQAGDGIIVVTHQKLSPIHLY